MKPQRPQRKTLCPEKDPPIKEISQRQGARRKSVWEELVIQRKAARKGTGCSPRRHLFIRVRQKNGIIVLFWGSILFSGSSAVGF
jgi:hypothetical protein